MLYPSSFIFMTIPRSQVYFPLPPIFLPPGFSSLNEVLFIWCCLEIDLWQVYCLLSRCHILSLVMTHVIYVVLKPWNNHANVITENELLLLSLISMCGLTFSSRIDLYLRIQMDTVLKELINRDISYHYACTAAGATFNLFTRVRLKNAG